MKVGLIALVLLLTSAELNSQSAQLPAPSDMKMIGLVGGTSWYSTVDYYRYINQAVNDAYGNNTNPTFILINLDNHRIQELQSRNQWDEVAAILADAVKRLQESGAQAVLLCSNTSHRVYAQVARKSGIPILHIGDTTGSAIRQRGLTKVGLIGTKYTMEDGFMVD